MKWQYAKIYVEALSRYHDPKTRPRTKGLISKIDDSARAQRFLVNFLNMR